MSDIKTRDIVKGTIKAIDKAAIAGERVKAAYVRARDKAAHGAHSAEDSPNEYADDRFSGSMEAAAYKAVRQCDEAGAQGCENHQRQYLHCQRTHETAQGRPAEKERRKKGRTEGWRSCLPVPSSRACWLCQSRPTAHQNRLCKACGYQNHRPGPKRNQANCQTRRPCDGENSKRAGQSCPAHGQDCGPGRPHYRENYPAMAKPHTGQPRRPRPAPKPRRLV